MLTYMENGMRIISQTISKGHHLPVLQLVKKMSKALLIITMSIVIYVVGSPQPTDAQIIQLDPDLVSHIQEALANNPDLAAWRNRVEAANERIPQVGSWPDPTVGISIANLPTNTFAFDQEAMTAAWIKVGQRIPLGGKPKAKSRIAESNFEAIQIGQEDKIFVIAREVTQTWYDWAYWQEAVKTVDINIDLLENLIAAARRKYETGRGLQQDILRAETERTRLEDRRVVLRQTSLTTGRRMAVLLGRHPDNPPESPGGLSEAFIAVNREILLRDLLKHNPSFNRIKAEVDATEARISFARRNWWPDLNLGVGYGYRQDSPEGMERPDFFTVSAGFSIPLYGGRKQGSAVEEAKAISREIVEQMKSLELELRFALEKLLDEDKRLGEQTTLYREGVIPQAEATLDAATAEYTVGRVDFEALLMAETAVYNAQLDYFARLRDRLKTRAALSALVGDEILIGKSEINH
ncbi:hypothetical protein CEE37_06875 [candidate division LCP-89 bacterium B3_LCP]|uniref:Transporter n=1 Tax=candidate division LCP-89 bacterium B3_LCP TaxID=2012998 RepID=A0A532V0E2_UNCL8|nr:MAG: hypothetical protein CEE37_06875 [candidate division LCP-89 bacterium B3_LCP]